MYLHEMDIEVFLFAGRFFDLDLRYLYASHERLVGTRCIKQGCRWLVPDCGPNIEDLVVLQKAFVRERLLYVTGKTFIG